MVDPRRQAARFARMERHRAFASLVLFSVVSCNSSSPPPPPPPSNDALVVAGSVAMQPLLEKWAAAFRAAHPSQPVVVQGGGSTAGVRAVQMGKAQCGALSRPLHPDETGVTAVPVALEALALVVNPKNPVDALTIAEAHALLVGGATSWKAVGGPDGAVDVVARGADARTLVDDVVTGQDPPPATAKVLDSAEQVRAAVAADASAIGYLPLPLVDRTVKAIKVAGVEASA